jgi:signal transduction protein with GAF and PtsI domain
MRSAAGGPRVLLRRLREVMAEPVSVQDRLNKIVVLIAVNMVAEVCSLYVLRIDGSLELFASEGLRPESVHVTVLRPDEGLVGLVASDARALNLSDAQQHPAFSFRPETGEEIYHSFLGVPILRAGNTLGVLTVQNRAYRSYSEDEEEALQTTAMVLAETIASGELSSRPSEPRPSASELSFKRPPPARAARTYSYRTAGLTRPTSPAGYMIGSRRRFRNSKFSWTSMRSLTAWISSSTSPQRSIAPL